MSKVELFSLQKVASKQHTHNKSNPSFVLISSDLSDNEKIKEEISKMPLVLDIIEVRGMYDLVVKIESDSNNEIRGIIGNKIRNVEGVRTCLSLLGFDPRIHFDKDGDMK